MTGEGGGRRLRMAALAPGIPHEMITLLDGAGIDVVIPPSRDQRGVRAVLDGADVVLADWSSALRLGSEEAAGAQGIGYIQNAGAGTDSIDLAAWSAVGVPVASTAGANAIGVAEWCVASALSVLRSLCWADAEVRTQGTAQLRPSGSLFTVPPVDTSAVIWMLSAPPGKPASLMFTLATGTATAAPGAMVMLL